MQVFLQAFIPRKLDDVVDFERDLERVRDGIDTDLVCHLLLFLLSLAAVHHPCHCMKSIGAFAALFHVGF